MARRAENIFFNGGLQGVKDNCNKMVACSAEPTNFDEANNLDTGTPAGFKLAEVSMTSGDYTEADGDVSGRKLTVAAKTLTGVDDGTATHIALIDTVNSNLYYVVPCTSVSISNTVTQDFSTWDMELEDPAAP